MHQGLIVPRSSGIVLVTKPGKVALRDGQIHASGESGDLELAWATPPWVAVAYAMRLQSVLLNAGIVPRAEFPFLRARDGG